MSQDDSKALSQQRFGQYAEGYVTSQTHASGDDLALLLAMAAPQADEYALDIATGGGHTALLLAPHMRGVVAGDLTPRMLGAARSFIAPKAANVVYAATDAENMAFASASFDLVTCRIAPHHFPDCFRFVQECARLLKPGGRLVVMDHVHPKDDQAARYIDAFEKLRDPSHHRAFAEYEWRGMFLDAGLSVARVEIVLKDSGKLLPWAERQGCTPEVIERLQVMLAQAPEAVAAWIRPRHVGTPEAMFDHQYILIAGHKPA